QLLAKRNKLTEEINELTPEVLSLDAEAKLAYKIKSAIVDSMRKENQPELKNNKNRNKGER
ncbi:MAG: hypothetical protein HUJ98_13785, partial [Bacteroidaceae bacterium]|nr:hypothetical protein [Bacteroidaceae bacterium]